jgi:hypothetical protein
MIFKPVMQLALENANHSKILFSFQIFESHTCGCADFCPMCLMPRDPVTGKAGPGGNYAYTGAGRKRVADMIAWLPRWSYAPAGEDSSWAAEAERFQLA